LRRSLRPTNPYQEHKNKRLVKEIGLTGRSTMEKKNLERERESAYQGEDDQIPTWNQAFHGGELKSPWRGPRSRDPCVGERVSKRKLILEREGHRSVFEDKHTGLTGMNLRFD
jgi:hypothetical protein